MKVVDWEGGENRKWIYKEIEKSDKWVGRLWCWWSKLKLKEKKVKN